MITCALLMHEALLNSRSKMVSCDSGMRGKTPLDRIGQVHKSLGFLLPQSDARLRKKRVQHTCYISLEVVPRPSLMTYAGLLSDWNCHGRSLHDWFKKE